MAGEKAYDGFLGHWKAMMKIEMMLTVATAAMAAWTILRKV
jgi:hypothetical protein